MSYLIAIIQCLLSIRSTDSFTSFTSIPYIESLCLWTFTYFLELGIDVKPPLSLRLKWPVTVAGQRVAYIAVQG